jgi:hypothetical protein
MVVILPDPPLITLLHYTKLVEQSGLSAGAVWKEISDCPGNRYHGHGTRYASELLHTLCGMKVP